MLNFSHKKHLKVSKCEGFEECKSELKELKELKESSKEASRALNNSRRRSTVDVMGKKPQRITPNGNKLHAVRWQGAPHSSTTEAV